MLKKTASEGEGEILKNGSTINTVFVPSNNNKTSKTTTVFPTVVPPNIAIGKSF